MSNEIEIFSNPSFGSVRAFADENGEPWFVAADVARVLGYDHTPNATRLLDDDEADVHFMNSRSVNGVEQAREVSIINESGLYHLVLVSKKPEAKKFRKWVTEEVLPSIRKTGSYSITKTNMDIAIYSDDPLERGKAIVAMLEEERAKQCFTSGNIRVWNPRFKNGDCLIKISPKLGRLNLVLDFYELI